MLRYAALVLIVGLAYGEASPSQSLKRASKGSAATQQAAPDSRGTDGYPLVVNEHAIQTKEEIAEQAARDAEQKHVNRWLIGLTVGLVVAAFLQLVGISLQVWVYLKQTAIMQNTLTAIGEQATTMAMQAQDARDAAVADAMIAQASLSALEAQAQSLRYQTTALRDSAQAALLNAQALITTERPWLVANFTTAQEDKIPESGLLRFNWEVKNVGRTPARLTFAAARVVFDIDREPLPDVPDYGEPDYWFTERVVVPGGTLGFLSHWYERKGGTYRQLYQTEEVKALDLLVGFGCVKYRDIFNSGKEYVTCFCDSSMIAGIDVSEPFSPWMDAPAAYTDCT